MLVDIIIWLFVSNAEVIKQFREKWLLLRNIYFWVSHLYNQSFPTILPGLAEHIFIHCVNTLVTISQILRDIISQILLNII